MSRGLVELAHAPQIEPVPLETTGWPAAATIVQLSSDDQSGAFTGVVSLPSGWRRGDGAAQGDTELFVLSGTIRIGDTLRGYGYYEFAPAGTDQEAWIVEDRCSLLLMARGSPEFVTGLGGSTHGRIERDTEQLPWTETLIGSHPPGVVMKILRQVEETGETVLLESIVPRWDYPVIEYHGCAEELFLVDGDMWLGNSGTMHPGSYLWRPAYYTHGPFYTRRGAVILAWLEADVDSRYVDDAHRSAEENRRDAEAEAEEERAPAEPA